MRYLKEKEISVEKGKKRPLMSLAGKRRHTKLFSPELPDSSRLLMRTMRSMRNNILFIALRSIY